MITLAGFGLIASGLTLDHLPPQALRPTVETTFTMTQILSCVSSDVEKSEKVPAAVILKPYCQNNNSQVIDGGQSSQPEESLSCELNDQLRPS